MSNTLKQHDMSEMSFEAKQIQNIPQLLDFNSATFLNAILKQEKNGPQQVPQNRPKNNVSRDFLGCIASGR